MTSQDVLEVKLIPNCFLLELPDLVVMIIAPLAPRCPYNAAAPGPFNTVTLSISSGLISAMPLPKSAGKLSPEVP
ncbi:hypothetical protein D3C87_1697610 [compost metagenome]